MQYFSYGQWPEHTYKQDQGRDVRAEPTREEFTNSWIKLSVFVFKVTSISVLVY